MDKKEFFSDDSERLDKFLSRELQESRNQIENLIKNGYVFVDTKKVSKTGYRLKEGEHIEVILPEVKKEVALEIDFSPKKIYEDADILVLSKPSGVVVHEAASHEGATLVDWLKLEGVSLSTISGEERHGIVHRLDKETSGVMVVAKNNQAHQNLSKQLQDRSMGRYYLALIDMPLKDHALVEKPLARNPKNRLKIGIVSAGKYAKSAFLKIAQSGQTELIAAKLYTGRTHQIRAHLESLSRHILGDYLYGFKSGKDRIARVFLHAYILYLKHPKTDELLFFRSEVPCDMREFLEISGFDMEQINEKIDTNSLIDSFGATF